MSAVAQLSYAPLRQRSPSSRQSGPARRVDGLADRSLVQLKSDRADFRGCLDEVEDLHRAQSSDASRTAGSYRTAKMFLFALSSTVPAPEVAIDGDGEFVFDWYGEDRQTVSVCTQSNGKLAFAARLSGGRVLHGHVYMDRTIPEEIMRAVYSLLRVPNR